MNSCLVALVVPSGREMEKGFQRPDESTVLLKADNHFHRIDVTFIFSPQARRYHSRQPGIPKNLIQVAGNNNGGTFSLRNTWPVSAGFKLKTSKLKTFRVLEAALMKHLGNLLLQEIFLAHGAMRTRRSSGIFLQQEGKLFSD